MQLLDQPLRQVVVYPRSGEFKSTWLGNKSIYRTRMAIADGGELIVLAPGVRQFGEDPGIDALIRKYGYFTTPRILRLVEENRDLQQNLSVAAHLIHGSSEERFTITYCPAGLTREQVEKAGFRYGDVAAMSARYDPRALRDGWNDCPDGETHLFHLQPRHGPVGVARTRFRPDAKEQWSMDQLADFGLIGLAVMGQNLVLNINDHGYSVIVFNRTVAVVDQFLRDAAHGRSTIRGAHTVAELVAGLKRPRKIMLLVKAGEAVDQTIELFFRTSSRGTASSTAATRISPTRSGGRRPSQQKGLLFIGTGVSGGEEGARHGPSIMPGREPRGLAAGEGDLPGHRGEDGRHALLRLGRGGRGRAFREDGAQRHRVRRHAAHLRGLPVHAGRAGHERRGHARGLRRVEQGRAGQLPHPDHQRHPVPQGR